MHHSSVWLVTAVLSLAMFLFLCGYLFIIYPPDDKKAAGSGDDSGIQFALQRLVGQAYNGDGEVAKLRPFRALGFLLVTLPASYSLYKRKLNEEKILQTAQ